MIFAELLGGEINVEKDAVFFTEYTKDAKVS